MPGCMREDHHKLHYRPPAQLHFDLRFFVFWQIMPFVSFLAPLATLTAGLLVSSSIRGIVQGKSKTTARLATQLEQLARENERLRQELRRHQKKAISEHQNSS